MCPLVTCWNLERSYHLSVSSIHDSFSAFQLILRRNIAPWKCGGGFCWTQQVMKLHTRRSCNTGESLIQAQRCRYAHSIKAAPTITGRTCPDLNRLWTTKELYMYKTEEIKVSFCRFAGSCWCNFCSISLGRSSSSFRLCFGELWLNGEKIWNCLDAVQDSEVKK